MIKVDNEKIGKYLAGLIEKKFDSTRKFCDAYLKRESGKEASEGEIQNLANRLSQIKNGKKAVQLRDLPFFSDLLDVSFEQILSGGESKIFKNDRMTNYTVAQSHSKKEWTAYIEREDRPVLNPDEYGKNILDYAIEFGNYKLIKFLVDEEYIWFDSRKDIDYIKTFGAGTSITKVIERYELCGNGAFWGYPGGDGLSNKIAWEDQLRMYIISFAADYNDLKMLEKLRAREIPELYGYVHYSNSLQQDINAHYDYDRSMVSHIAGSSEKVLDYFTDSFAVRDCIKYKDGSKRKHTFVFPFISQLLDELIENNSFFLKRALEKSIEHNEKTLERLKELIQAVIDCYDWLEENCDIWKQDIRFHVNGSIVNFLGLHGGERMITNIIHVTKESEDEKANRLIKELNESYDRIRSISEGINT